MTEHEFVIEFSAMMEKFGDGYLRRHRAEVNGVHLVRALIRWAAATIAAAPPPERAGLLLGAIRQLHGDLDHAEQLKPPERLN